MQRATALVVAVAACAACAANAAKLPHLVFLLADDLGWADVGWHRPAGYDEVRTPNLDTLVAQGVEMERHYAHKYCSPSRSAFQSGRAPIHVNVNNFLPTVHNPADPVSGFAAIPRNMSGLATRLKEANYTTVMAGKWDAGMATPDHTPQGRGYDHSLFYFHHANDYWTSQVTGQGCVVPNETGHGWHAYTRTKHAGGGGGGDGGQWTVRGGYLAVGNDVAPKRTTSLADAEACCLALADCNGFTFEDYDEQPAHNVSVSFKTKKARFVADPGVLPQDLWMDGAPAPQLANNASVCGGSPWPAAHNASLCTYEDELFANFILDRVREHDPTASPLFVFWAFHIAHSPYQVPETYFDQFAFINNTGRQTYHAMVHFLDDKVGQLLALLHAKDMYDETLIVFSAGACLRACVPTWHPPPPPWCAATLMTSPPIPHHPGLAMTQTMAGRSRSLQTTIRCGVANTAILKGEGKERLR